MIVFPDKFLFKMKENQKWKDMVARMKNQPDIFQDNYSFGSFNWKGIKEEALKYKDAFFLLCINVRFNSFPYIKEEKDVWSTPYEFIQNNGGDCEDFAIIKYYALLNLGIKKEDLAFLLVQQRKDNVAHAALLVHYLNELYVLDNVKKSIVKYDSIIHYKPLQVIMDEKTYGLADTHVVQG